MNSALKTPDKLDPFLSTAIDHGYLNESDALRVCRATVETNETSADVALRLGILDGVDTECVRALSQPHATIPGYELLDVLGVGGMGIVFYARQTKMDRKVALKLLSKSRFCDEDAKRRFRRESLAVARMRHPNIVTAFDSGESTTQHYLAMEFVDGIDLEEWVETNGAMSEFHAWSIIKQVCQGLRHAASQGVIHRDVKPPNIILSNHSVEPKKPSDTQSSANASRLPIAKIADFGLAIRYGHGAPNDRVTGAHSFLGSPPYVAPEQLEHASLDHRCDIYALGATALHLLSGTVPYQGMSVPEMLSAKLRKRTLPIHQELDHCSPFSRQLVGSMMEPKVNRRLPDFDTLIQLIDRILALDEVREMASPMVVSPSSSELRQSLSARHQFKPTIQPKVRVEPGRNAIHCRRPQRTTIQMKHAYGVGWACVAIFAIVSVLRFDAELASSDHDSKQPIASRELNAVLQTRNAVSRGSDLHDQTLRRPSGEVYDGAVYSEAWQSLTRFTRLGELARAFEPANESNQSAATMYGVTNAQDDKAHDHELMLNEGMEAIGKAFADREEVGLMEGLDGRVEVAEVAAPDVQRPESISKKLRPITHVSLPVQPQVQLQPIVVLPPPRQEPKYLGMFLGGGAPVGGGPAGGPGGGGGQPRRGGGRR